MNMPPMMQVESSLIQEIGYEEKDRRLFIKFKTSGQTYTYDNFLPEDWEKFRDAESHGKWFHAHIKKNFRGEKLEHRQEWEK